MSNHEQIRTHWKEHWTNGGTGITKLAIDLVPVSESVRLFGDKSIEVRGNELHCTRERISLSDFWEFHRNRIGEKW